MQHRSGKMQRQQSAWLCVQVHAIMHCLYEGSPEQMGKWAAKFAWHQVPTTRIGEAAAKQSRLQFGRPLKVSAHFLSRIPLASWGPTQRLSGPQQPVEGLFDTPSLSRAAVLCSGLGDAHYTAQQISWPPMLADGFLVVTMLRHMGAVRTAR